MPFMLCEHIRPDGRQLNFRADYQADGGTVTWGGKVLLPDGRWHQLQGGQIVNVAPNQEAPAVTQAANAEVDGLDVQKLLEA